MDLLRKQTTVVVVVLRATSRLRNPSKRQAAWRAEREKTFPSSFFFWQDDLVAYQHAEAEDQVLGGFGDAGAFLLFGLFHGGQGTKGSVGATANNYYIADKDIFFFHEKA